MLAQRVEVEKMSAAKSTNKDFKGAAISLLPAPLLADSSNGLNPKYRSMKGKS